MAKFIMYSVKDELTGKFMNPMFTEESELSDQDATRQFRSSMINIKLWHDNPNDYSLYRVGVFDDEAGAEAIPIEKVIGGRSLIE